MKSVLLGIGIVLLSLSATAQKLSGQWIGEFGDATDASGIKTTYVLEIEVNGQQITGYSYTYFTISGKRYYVICKLKGQYESGSKSLVVNEVEKIKANTPPGFENCLQSHQLTYLQQKDKEILSGKWKPYEKGSNCGSGTTELERKKINFNSTPDKSNKVDPETKPAPKPETKKPQVDTQSPKPSSKPLADKITKRTYEIVKTFVVNPTTVNIDIYDFGQVDGDTVMIFLNEKLLIPEKHLTEKPISFSIKLEEKGKTYDLIMFAKSEGTIPPNTANMVVTINNVKEEFKISSTEKISRAIRFVVNDK